MANVTGFGSSELGTVPLLGSVHQSEQKMKSRNCIQQIVIFVQQIFQLIADLFSSCFGFSSKVSNLSALDNSHDLTSQPAELYQLKIDSSNHIIFNKTTRQYTYLSRHPIKNLVISGGGAKGVILPGVFKAFEEHKTNGISFRDGLDHVAGSSVGAISAILLAVGMSAEAIITATGSVDFKELLGKSTGRLPGIYKDGNPLLKFMRTHIQATLKEHLFRLFQVNDLNEIANLRNWVEDRLEFNCKDYSVEQINEIHQNMQNLLATLKKENSDDVRVTFAMLRTLREFDSKNFKELTVTATCNEKKEDATYYFDADNCPLLEIALAGRASASLPGILMPVKIEPEFLLPRYVTDKPLTFSDGGYLDNIPVLAMQDKQGKGKHNRGESNQNLQTLALVFDESGRAEHEQSPFHDHLPKAGPLYKARKRDKITRDVGAKWLGGMQTQGRNTAAKAEGLERIRTDHPHRSIPLLVSVKTNDFAAAKAQEKIYSEKGYQQGMAYLEAHHDSLSHRCFDTFEEMLEYIPEDIQRAKAAELAAFKAEHQ